MSDRYTTRISGDLLEIALEDGYEINRASVERLWEVAAHAYEQRGCRRILAEGRVQRTMSVADVYVSASTPARKRMYGLRVALVWHDFEPDALSKLFSDAASNRGATVRYFRTRDEALAWLGAAQDGATRT